jgi:ATP adenylyltransferase
MANPSLYAPWRMEYIRSMDKPGDGCFLCEAGSCDESEFSSRMILWRTDLSVVLINRYPYTNGHLLIAPRTHKADFEALTDDELLDAQAQTALAIRLLKDAMSPQGFNVGINLGRVAGAGVPGHVHQHVVPRWAGDTNFMTVIGEVRVVPQAMTQLYDELMRVRATM